MINAETIRAYRDPFLHNMAGVGSVDNTDTAPGIAFLRDVRDSYLDARSRFNEDSYVFDVLNELADSAVPNNRRDVWVIFGDLQVWASDLDDEVITWPTSWDDVTDLATTALVEVARTLLHQLYAEDIEDDELADVGRDEE